MKKSNKYGIVGSFLFCGILLILLLFIYLPGLKKPEDEGLMISFGETEEGSGMTQTPAPKPVVVPVSAPPKPVKPVKQDLMTQTDNSLAIAEQKKKDEQRKEQQIIERQRLENERIIERQRLENERIQAEKKRKQQEAIEKASMDGLFGNNKSSGSGPSTGETPKGNPGKGSSGGGNSANVSGRKPIGGKIAEPNTINQEGTVIVSINVDANGNVTSAKRTGGNISEAATIKMVEDAARRTKFTGGNGEARGTITYNLVFGKGN